MHADECSIGPRKNISALMLTNSTCQGFFFGGGEGVCVCCFFFVTAYSCLLSKANN